MFSGVPGHLQARSPLGAPPVGACPQREVEWLLVGWGMLKWDTNRLPCLRFLLPLLFPSALSEPTADSEPAVRVWG